MSKKVLGMTKPLITSYPTHTNCLAICGNNPDSYAWFYENYVQLLARPGRNVFNSYVNFYAPYPWKACPWLEAFEVPRSLIISGWKKLSAFIIDAVSEGFYVLTYLNRFHMPGTPQYNTQHFGHDTLLYGYDTGDSTVFAADFFNDSYGQRKFEFADIDKAFKDDGYYKEICDDFNDVVLMRLREATSFTFSPVRYKKKILEFLSCVQGDVLPSYGYKEHNFLEPSQYIYGLDVYDRLAFYIEQRTQDNEGSLDIRGFHTLYDHSKMLNAEVNYLDSIGALRKDELSIITNSLTNMALALRNNVILMNQTQEFRRKNYCIRTLYEIKSMVEKDMELILKCL